MIIINKPRRTWKLLLFSFRLKSAEQQQKFLMGFTWQTRETSIMNWLDCCFMCMDIKSIFIISFERLGREVRVFLVTHFAPSSLSLSVSISLENIIIILYLGFLNEWRKEGTCYLIFITRFHSRWWSNTTYEQEEREWVREFTSSLLVSLLRDVVIPPQT